MSLIKPPVVQIWGDSNQTSADMVKPTDAQILAGWPLSSTPPSRQRWNWILNFCANGIRYFSRRGIADYDGAETYQLGDVTRGSDGLIYRSLQANNTSHAPQSSPTWWGPAQGPTAAQDDSSKAIASTEYVLGQLASANPLMNGATAAPGASKRFARGDHIHPSDDSKANTAGTYPSLSVGFATNAGHAANADNATDASHASSADNAGYASNAGNATNLGGIDSSQYFLNLGNAGVGRRGAVDQWNPTYSHTLPAGGTWFYFSTTYTSSGTLAGGGGSFVAGGTTLNAGPFASISGFAIRAV